jgi:DNA-binding beta-propeller fold protein YncE
MNFRSFRPTLLLTTPHKRFFISNTTQNRIDVFDGSSESEIGSVIVPLPFGLDVAPDRSKFYVGTTFGDVYLIDPGVMHILQLFPSATLRPQGYTATQALILADGRLALLGALGGL